MIVPASTRPLPTSTPLFMWDLHSSIHLSIYPFIHSSVRACVCACWLSLAHVRGLSFTNPPVLSVYSLSHLFHLAPSPCSRLTQGEVVCQWDSDPEAACSVAENKPASRHFYPIALLLVSSHLLVVWLILSLVFLLAKYQ